MREHKLIEILEKKNAEVICELKKEIAGLRKKKYYSYKEAAELLCISIEGLKHELNVSKCKGHVTMVGH